MNRGLLIGLSALATFGVLAATTAAYFVLTPHTKTPDEVCASHSVQDQILSIAFDAAGRVATSSLSNDSEVPKNEVLSEITLMRGQNLLRFNYAALLSFDKETKRVSCMGDVQITTAAQDSTANAKEMMSDTQFAGDAVILPGVAISGTDHTSINYWTQPAAGQKQGTLSIFGSENDVPLDDTIFAIAVERVRVRHFVENNAKADDSGAAANADADAAFSAANAAITPAPSDKFRDTTP